MDPVTIAAIISAVSALAGTAGTLAGDKGSPIDMASSDPQMDEYRRELMARIMEMIGKERPYAKVNPMNLAANNMASQYYTGQPYTHPGYGMGSVYGPERGTNPNGNTYQSHMPGQQGPGAMPLGGMPRGMGGPPMGGMPQGLPQVPGAPGGMPMRGPQYGPQLQKGANFAR